MVKETGTNTYPIGKCIFKFKKEEWCFSAIVVVNVVLPTLRIFFIDRLSIVIGFKQKMAVFRSTTMRWYETKLPMEFASGCFIRSQTKVIALNS